MNVAGDFVVNLLGGIVEKLIPRSWIHKGLDIMAWLVAVPDYTARVSTPGGGHAYGFQGVNDMRGLYTWMGVSIAPLTLIYATSRAFVGQGDPPHIPVARVLVVGVLLINYGWLWSQAVALTNQLTHAILGVSAVTSGIEKMFEVLIAGAALGGLPLIGLLVMGAGALQLISMLFVKVTLILVGALVFAIGPLMIGLVPTERGNAFARAWLTIALGLFVLPFLWAATFAIAAVLVNDASRGASVIGGDSGIGETLGGLLLAMAAIAGFWLNIKLTKAFAGLVGGQLAGLLALAGGGARALLGGASRAQLTLCWRGSHHQRRRCRSAARVRLEGRWRRVRRRRRARASRSRRRGARRCGRARSRRPHRHRQRTGVQGPGKRSEQRRRTRGRQLARRHRRDTRRTRRSARLEGRSHREGHPDAAPHTEPGIAPCVPSSARQPCDTSGPSRDPSGDGARWWQRCPRRSADRRQRRSEQAIGEGQHERGPDIAACSAPHADTAAFNGHEPPDAGRRTGPSAADSANDAARNAFGAPRAAKPARAIPRPFKKKGPRS